MKTLLILLMLIGTANAEVVPDVAKMRQEIVQMQLAIEEYKQFELQIYAVAKALDKEVAELKKSFKDVQYQVDVLTESGKK